MCCSALPVYLTCPSVLRSAVCLTRLQRGLLPVQDRLTVVEEQHAQAEYELSDKSASLAEAQEQLAEVRRHLADVRQAQAQAAAAGAEQSKAAEHAATELEAERARTAELVAALAEAEGALEAQQAAALASAAALAARVAELEAQRSATGPAEQRASELAAQLRQMQHVTLVEKEQQVRCPGWCWPTAVQARGCQHHSYCQGPCSCHLPFLGSLFHLHDTLRLLGFNDAHALQLLLGRAEVKELREQLAAQEEAAEKLQVGAAWLFFAFFLGGWRGATC